MHHGMIFTGRRVGLSLYVIAGRAFIDWCLALVAFQGPPAIVGLILYGELYSHSVPPLPFGLIYLPCPGNGFGFLCGPRAIWLLVLFALGVVVILYVNVRRRPASESGLARVDLMDRRRLWITLAIAASALLAFGFVWGWINYFGIGGQLPVITSIYNVVAPFIHLLFIVTGIAAGRHLRRSGQSL